LALVDKKDKKESAETLSCSIYMPISGNFISLNGFPSNEIKYKQWLMTPSSKAKALSLFTKQIECTSDVGDWNFFIVEQL
jgi:hypothetical protein